jgi:hypothetical protein
MKHIQIKRTKGWKMPTNTVYVGRPTNYGNPFRLTTDGWIQYRSTISGLIDPWIIWGLEGFPRGYPDHVTGFNQSDVVELYERWILGEYRWMAIAQPPDITPLIGKDLACWCPLDKPCHADVLIKLLTE